MHEKNFTPLYRVEFSARLFMFGLEFLTLVNEASISMETIEILQPTLHEKFPYSELFRSVFPCIRNKYWEIRCISQYSVRMRENADRNNSEYGHFSRSARHDLEAQRFWMSNWIEDWTNWKDSSRQNIKNKQLRNSTKI